MNIDYCYVCLKWGTKYTADYVNKLASMVRRWDPSDRPIYCYTDDATDIDPSVNVIEIGNLDYETWWFKLPLLVNPTINKHQTKVLFDLDVILHGDISKIHTHASDQLTVCSSLWKSPDILHDKAERNTLYNSSVMVWNDASYVYEHFARDPEKYMATYKGIDRFLWHESLDVSTLPPNIVYSYRKGATLKDNAPYKYRPEYSVCLFHGYPKQEDVLDASVVRKHWL